MKPKKTQRAKSSRKEDELSEPTPIEKPETREVLEARRILAVLAKENMLPPSYDSLAVNLMAMAAALRKHVRMGEKSAIQTAVRAADKFAEIVEIAHKEHLPILKDIASQEPSLAVRISPRSIADENPDRKDLREFLKQAGVGTKSIPPTATKTWLDATWMNLAEKVLQEIIQMKDALKYHPGGNEFLDSLILPTQTRAEQYRTKIEQLPPPAKANLAPWWKLAKELLEDYWESKPSELLKAESMAEKDERCKNGKRTPHELAVSKVYDSFRALMKAR